ncbi:MAG: ABC transporter permease, partial [Acidobacteria bacterium]|nr:ABC transporter permease [Acidobacteriota bacterium]
MTMAETTNLVADARPEHPWVVLPRSMTPAETIRQIWEARHFVVYIGRRTLLKIYRRTVLGWAWLFILPLFPFMLRTVVFGGLLQVPSGGTPYLLFLMAGSVCWDFFASAVNWGTRGLQMNEGVLKYAYVPRVALPIATMAPALLDLAIKTALLIVMGIVFAVVTPGHSLVWSLRLPWALVAIALSFLAALSITLYTSVWGRSARDARFTMSQVISVWGLLTPVVYPMSEVPAKWQSWMMLNPMAAAVETFKWAVLGVGTLPLEALRSSAIVMGLALTGGLVLYGAIERRADDGE